GRGAMAVRLEHSGKVYGILAVSIPVELIADKEEQALFKEVASDIAFALHNIDLEEKRKQAEEALKESEGRYRALFRANADGILIADSQTKKFVFANPVICQMLGYSEGELTKLGVGDIHPKDNLGYIISEFEAHGGGERELIENIPCLRKDGQIIYVDIKGTVALVDGRKVNVGFFRDITERKRMDKKARELETLREVDRLRSGLLANVSHELRTPLTSIKGFATTLLRSDVRWSEEDQQDFLQSIDQETERLIRLINDLLDMSRIEAGGLKLERYNYQIADILDSVNSRLASLTEHHQLQVIVPSELPPVFVDEMRIGQVLTNLVENATKYSPEDSQITIEAQLAGDQIIISVTDTGESIPTEFLDRVFDRFYQAESIVTGRKSGTGLGLPICKGIIESHGGRIWVESKVGKGSNFSFNLPTSEREEQVA
ncbi:MAG: PAS domain S-box protein, partial [Anaerolineales bacterium]|nr:PAS domain S-box protein [Anaerolineales bacterium]